MEKYRICQQKEVEYKGEKYLFGRIVATKRIEKTPNGVIEEGALGGWILMRDGKALLSQEGNCWVDSTSIVCGPVDGNALVCNSKIYHGYIGGDALVQSSELSGVSVYDRCKVLDSKIESKSPAKASSAAVRGETVIDGSEVYCDLYTYCKSTLKESKIVGNVLELNACRVIDCEVKAGKQKMTLEDRSFSHKSISEGNPIVVKSLPKTR